MVAWFAILVTACIAALLKTVLSWNSKHKSRLPPGPRVLPIISSVLWLRKSSTEMEENLRTLRSKFGPIITLQIGSYSLIFISSRSLAHQALVQNGAIFADRPHPSPTTKIIGSNQHDISSAAYGPKWRLLRRNLTSQILQPSKARDFSHARKWALDILLTRLHGNITSDNRINIKVIDHFRYAMFCLLVFMCFGEKLDEDQIREIESIQYRMLMSFTRFQILNYWPWLTKILLRGLWNELYNMKKEKGEVLIPHIRERKRQLQDKLSNDESSILVTCYVDALLTLELPEDGVDGSGVKRNLSEEQMVSACSEFFDAGTDTTSTALQWIMANLVKNPDIQAKLFQEIKGIIGPEAKEVGEDDLTKMSYLKAVVLEGLRRHPPGHFVLPHAVTQDVELGGYTLPKNAIINFTVAEIGWDPEVWEDPMQFKPERFMPTMGSNIQEEFDITGSREIKMMPFGAGRRICPGFGLAMLHLEYFVANLVWNFEWAAVDGNEVDLSEKQEFTIVMKHPLHVHISPRIIDKK